MRTLRALLDYTPAVAFCVIDGLSDLEWGGGRKWCEELLNLLKNQQQHAGGVFIILLSTTSQPLALPMYVKVEDRYIITERAKEARIAG